MNVGHLLVREVPEREQPVDMPANQVQQETSFTSALDECVVCGAIFVDANQAKAVLTPEAARMLGMPGASPLEQPFGALPGPIQALIREVSAASKPISNRRLELSVGGWHPALVRVSAVPLPPGKANTGVLLALTDLRSARQVTARIQRIDRLARIGTLSASLAHEIKNALVASKTFIDLLLERNQDTELAVVVQREVRRIEALVSQMLRFVAPARAAFRAVHLHEVLEQSLRLVEPQLEHKSIAAERSFAATSDLVRGDEGQLEQAFVNLFLNALEAMGAHGRLTVGTEIVPPGALNGALPEKGETEHLRVWVQDTGSGIAPANMGRLFEPFFTTKPNGTGLGLSITQRIVQEHHGQLSVESEPGKGATFSILLPTLSKP